MQKSRKNIFIITSITIALLCGCMRIKSDELNSKEEKPIEIVGVDEIEKEDKDRTYVSTKIKDMDLELKEDMGKLYLSFEEQRLNLGKGLNDGFSEEPVLDIISSDDNIDYIGVYTTFYYCGGAGKYVPFKIVKLNRDTKEMSMVFDSENLSMNHYFKDESFFISLDHSEYINIDIRKSIEGIASYKQDMILKDEDELAIGNCSGVNIMDFTGDGQHEALLRVEVNAVESGVDLAYIYILLNINQDGLRLQRFFQGDLDNRVLSNFLSKDVQVIDDKETEIDKKELIKGKIVKEVDGKLYLR